MVTMLTPVQCRMARAALQLTVRDFANLADVTANTINRFETGKTAGSVKTIVKIQKALEEAGIEFIGNGESSDGGGVGVRLRDPG